MPTFYSGGTGPNPLVRIEVTETAPGVFTLTVTQVQATDPDAAVDPDGAFYLGDLRAFYLDFAESESFTISNFTGYSGYSLDGAVVATSPTATAYGTESVTSVGSKDTNMSGSGETTYDAGLEIGTQGAGKDDVGSIQFTVTGPGLTLEDFVNATFGTRVTSVGLDANNDGDVSDRGETRTESSKISSETPGTAAIVLGDATASEGSNVTITATVSAPVAGTPLVITLSNGATITIPVGATTGTSTPFLAQTDDVYIDAGSYTVAVTGTSGSNFTTLNTADTATVSVVDTIDTATVTLTASSVTEGADAAYTFTATLSHASQGETTITTDQGVITIADGETVGTLVVGSNGEDAHNDSSSLTATITAVSGGNFENLTGVGNSASAHITDTIDTTTISLDSPTVDEGGNVTVTATVDNAPQGSDLVITLSNGEVITIAAGETSGSATFPVQGDDPYVDGASFELTIGSATGGNYEDLDDSAVSTVTVEDTIDTTTISLDSPTVDEGGNVTVTATVDNAPQGSDLVITLSNGEVITIAAGETSGSATFPVQGDDPYVDGASFELTIGSATGGNYEDLDDSAVSTVTVEDTIDTTTISLDSPTVDEGGNVTVTATVDNAPQGSDLVITLSNGEVITIAAGETSGSATFPVQGDDPYVDGASFELTIGSATGGNYEDLDDSAVSTVTVEDTIDTTTISLDSPTVDEGGNVTVTATVDNAPQGSDLVITLSNGEVITIAAGETSGSATFPVQGDDPYVDGASFELTIGSATGGNYEDLDDSAVSTVTVEDTIDTTVVDLTVDDDSVTEGSEVTVTATVANQVQGSPLMLTLSNGSVITIAVGQTSGTASFIASSTTAVAIASYSGSNFEALDTSDTAAVTVAPNQTTISGVHFDPNEEAGNNGKLGSFVADDPSAAVTYEAVVRNSSGVIVSVVDVEPDGDLIIGGNVQGNFTVSVTVYDAEGDPIGSSFDYNLWVGNNNDNAFNFSLASTNNIGAAQGGGDFLQGSNGEDFLYGGSGVDRIVGMDGNDWLLGGPNADVFAMTAPVSNGTDLIADFTAGADKIALMQGGSGWNAAGSSGTDFSATGGAALATADYLNFASLSVVTASANNRVVELQQAQTTASMTTSTSSAAVNAYVVVFNSTTGNAEIWHDTNWADVGNRTQVATLDGENFDTLSEVQALSNADFNEWSVI